MSIPPAGAAGRTVLGHPRGLLVLSGTEGFVGFAYYGLQSILVLYLGTRMLLPSHAAHVWGLGVLGRLLGWHGDDAAGHRADAHAAALASLFGAFAFAAPLVGGVIADRLLGRFRAIVSGCVALTLGLCLLTIEPLFLFGLLSCLVGIGLCGTLKAQLGALYSRDDPRRADAFQVYSFSVQVAVLVTPIVCGTLGQEYGWSFGFAAAAIGIALGLAFYLSGRRTLPPEPSGRALPAPAAAPSNTVSPVVVPRLTRRDGLVLLGLGLLLPVLALTLVGNQELFAAYLLWGRDHHDLRWNGHALPVSWLLSMDAFISMATTVLSVAVWSFLERRGRPVSELPKIAIGAAFCAAALLVLAAAPPGRVGLGWGLGFHLLNDIGFTNTYAVSLALYSRLAPPALGSTVVNAAVLQIFLANLLVSRLAGLFGTIPASRFWLLHAALVAAGAIALAVVVLVRRTVRERSPRPAFPPENTRTAS